MHNRHVVELIIEVFQSFPNVRITKYALSVLYVVYVLS